MLKKRQNEVKRKIFLFDEVKKSQTYPADYRKIAAVGIFSVCAPPPPPPVRYASPSYRARVIT